MRTRVGYAGGTTPDPTYRKIGDHTETLQIDYDPARITYERLLGAFWEGHDACARPRSTQYQAIVFVHDAEQRRWAEASKVAEEKRRGRKILTEIREAPRFYRAEDYHQKYRLRRHGVLEQEYEAIYPELREFTDSTATARVNGYVAGHGTAEQLAREIDDLGLSPEARKLLVRIAGARPAR